MKKLYKLTILCCLTLYIYGCVATPISNDSIERHTSNSKQIQQASLPVHKPIQQSNLSTASKAPTKPKNNERSTPAFSENRKVARLNTQSKRTELLNDKEEIASFLRENSINSYRPSGSSLLSDDPKGFTDNLVSGLTVVKNVASTLASAEAERLRLQQAKQVALQKKQKEREANKARSLAQQRVLASRIPSTRTKRTPANTRRTIGPTRPVGKKTSVYHTGKTKVIRDSDTCISVRWVLDSSYAQLTLVNNCPARVRWFHADSKGLMVACDAYKTCKNSNLKSYASKYPIRGCSEYTKYEISKNFARCS